MKRLSTVKTSLHQTGADIIAGCMSGCDKARLLRRMEVSAKKLNAGIADLKKLIEHGK